jgi:hypothetical protein
MERNRFELSPRATTKPSASESTVKSRVKSIEDNERERPARNKSPRYTMRVDKVGSPPPAAPIPASLVRSELEQVSPRQISPRSVSFVTETDQSVSTTSPALRNRRAHTRVTVISGAPVPGTPAATLIDRAVDFQQQLPPPRPIAPSGSGASFMKGVQHLCQDKILPSIRALSLAQLRLHTNRLIGMVQHETRDAPPLARACIWTGACSVVLSIVCFGLLAAILAGLSCFWLMWLIIGGAGLVLSAVVIPAAVIVLPIAGILTLPLGLTVGSIGAVMAFLDLRKKRAAAAASTSDSGWRASTQPPGEESVASASNLTASSLGAGERVERVEGGGAAPSTSGGAGGRVGAGITAGGAGGVTREGTTTETASTARALAAKGAESGDEGRAGPMQMQM